MNTTENARMPLPATQEARRCRNPCRFSASFGAAASCFVYGAKPIGQPRHTGPTVLSETRLLLIASRGIHCLRMAVIGSGPALRPAEPARG